GNARPAEQKQAVFCRWCALLIIGMDYDARHACQNLAAGQYGVISRRQALDLGLSPATLRRRVASGEWESWLPGTYLTASGRPSWHQSLMAAVRWGGTEAVVSHRAGAALFRLAGGKAGRVGGTTRPPR